MTFFRPFALGLASGFVAPLLLGAAAFGQTLPGPGSMNGAAPAMPGAPIAPPGMATGSTSGGGMAPGMSQNMPAMMPQATAPQGVAPGATAGTTTMAPPTAPMNGTMMNGGSATDGPVMTAFHGKVYQTHKGDLVTQGFLTIQNQGGGADTLTAVSCPIADTTTLVDAGGTTLNNLDVAAGASVVLAPKGLHLQLQTLHFQVYRGSVIPCVLTFHSFGQIEVMLYADKPDNY